MKDIYEDFTEYLEKEEIALHWNTTESALKFLNEKVLNHNQKNNNSNQQIDLTNEQERVEILQCFEKIIYRFDRTFRLEHKKPGKFFCTSLA